MPEGTWTHFLTGETVTGPRWVREQHGFLSVPLLVRPGAVIPVGAVHDRPDYAYADGVTLRAFDLARRRAGHGAGRRRDVHRGPGGRHAAGHGERSGRAVGAAVRGADGTGGGGHRALALDLDAAGAPPAAPELD